MSMTDSPEFHDAIDQVPDRFAERLDAEGLDVVRDALEAGEWAYALEELAARLVHAGATITRVERHQLAELFRASNADLAVLDEVKRREEPTT